MEEMEEKVQWCANIERTDQSVLAYRLSDDLQFALNIDPKGQRHLRDALIVIPLAPYIFDHAVGGKEDVLPPYGIGQVKDIFKLPEDEAYQLVVTRSQFVGDNRWATNTFEDVEGYLRHDYPHDSKMQIDEDIKYWQGINAGRPVHQSSFLRQMTNSRISLHLQRVAAKRPLHQRDQWLLKARQSS